ncbi:hypothetical protein AK812_SmicGene8307 [Symbiodinium microadriaticum]|uniref:Uncharacterized protein n=1 Tax=Symbiodinium microadriaticum TaxID=2951 RepID=A0A1Q9ELE1_SYMMI|nr:hypothetical protein AK812_SmicGene8307 [Symbiodinium microadriaticum]
MSRVVVTRGSGPPVPLAPTLAALPAQVEISPWTDATQDETGQWQLPEYPCEIRGLAPDDPKNVKWRPGEFTLGVDNVATIRDGDKEESIEYAGQKFWDGELPPREWNPKRLPANVQELLKACLSPGFDTARRGGRCLGETAGYSGLAKSLPPGKIPALQVFESGAILMYLADKYGGLDTPEKRWGTKIFYFNAAGLITAQWYQSAVNEEEQQRELLSSPDLKLSFTNQEDGNGRVLGTGLADDPPALRTLDALLADREFLLGSGEDSFSVADVAVGSYLLYVPLFFPDINTLPRWPNIQKPGSKQRYMLQLLQRPAYAKAFGEGTAQQLQKVVPHMPGQPLKEMFARMKALEPRMFEDRFFADILRDLPKDWPYLVKKLRWAEERGIFTQEWDDEDSEYPAFPRKLFKGYLRGKVRRGKMKKVLVHYAKKLKEHDSEDPVFVWKEALPAVRGLVRPSEPMDYTRTCNILKDSFGIVAREGIVYAVMHALPEEKLAKLDDGQFFVENCLPWGGEAFSAHWQLQLADDLLPRCTESLLQAMEENRHDKGFSQVIYDFMDMMHVLGAAKLLEDD